MKLKFLLLLLLVFVAITPVSAFAADGDNLFLGKTLVNATNGANAFDGNASTYANFTTQTVTLSGINVPVASVVFKYITENGAYSGLYTFRYTDGTVKSDRLYNTNGAMTTVTVTLDPAKTLASFSYNASGGYWWRMYEIEAYGAPNLANPNDFVITNLAATGSGQMVNLKWTAVVSQYFKQYNIYNGNTKVADTTTNAFSINNLVAGSTNTFRVSAVDTYGKEYDKYSVLYTAPEPDKKPPPVPSGLSAEPSKYDAVLHWSPVLDTDKDLAGYYVYLGTERINSTPFSGTSYALSGLKMDTDYVFSVASVDTSGNVSQRSDLKSFKTLTVKPPPTDPASLTGSAYSKYVKLSWSPSAGASAYKVYKNNVLYSTVYATNTTVTGLTDGTTYTFTVSAVNDVGESGKSNQVSLKPELKAIPEVSLGGSGSDSSSMSTAELTDIATAVRNWFGSYWLILAFCISIPLSFYIANRVKGLIVS